MTATTAQRTYQMLENQTLWETATRVNRLFAAQGIEHAVVGGVAVCLHGYRRNTVDLDLLIRPEDSGAVRSALELDGLACHDKLHGNSRFREELFLLVTPREPI